MSHAIGAKMFSKSIATVAAIVVLLVSNSLEAAEKKYGPGVSDTEIKLGQTVPYSGPASAFSSYGRVMIGYFKMINDNGGINGRKVTLYSLDNAYTPTKAVEQTRKLIEDVEVLADVGTVGAAPNAAIQKYLNQKSVPQLYVSAGGSRFNDPKNYPWTVPMYPDYIMDGRTIGEYVLKAKPDAKVAVLYQNDDYGKDFYSGVKSALMSQHRAKVTAEATHELGDPTIDSQIVRLKSSGADVLLLLTSPKFAAQALRKVNELDWKPMKFLASPASSVEGVLKPAGLQNVQGVLTTQFTKQIDGTNLDSDPETKEWAAFMAKYDPTDSPGDFVALSGYIIAQAIEEVLRRCGDDLSRENLLKQATSLNGQRFKMHLPGISLKNSADNYAPYQSLRVARFEGKSYRLVDDVNLDGVQAVKE